MGRPRPGRRVQSCWRVCGVLNRAVDVASVCHPFRYDEPLDLVTYWGARCRTRNSIRSRKPNGVSAAP